MLNIFEKATKEKIRFEYKGTISVEDLWDLNVESLDSIFKVLNSEMKQTEEDSLLKKETVANTLLNTKIKIVKHIVNVKLAQTKNMLEAKELAEKREKLMSILAKKQDSELESKSPEELQAMLESIKQTE